MLLSVIIDPLDVKTGKYRNQQELKSEDGV